MALDTTSILAKLTGAVVDDALSAKINKSNINIYGSVKYFFKDHYIDEGGMRDKGSAYRNYKSGDVCLFINDRYNALHNKVVYLSSMIKDLDEVKTILDTIQKKGIKFSPNDILQYVPNATNNLRNIPKNITTLATLRSALPSNIDIDNVQELNFVTNNDITNIVKSIKVVANPEPVNKPSTPAKDGYLARLYDVLLVPELGDLRIARFINEFKMYPNSRPITRFGLVAVRPGHELYDHLDLNRLFIMDQHRIKFIGVLDASLVPAYVDALSLDYRKVRNFCRRKGLTVVGRNDLLQFRDLEKLKSNKKNALKDAMSAKLKNLKNSKKLNISGLVLTPTSFEYSGITVDCSHKSVTNNYLDAVSRLTSVIGRNNYNNRDTQEILNFNTVFEEFVKNLESEISSWKYATGNKSFQFKLGNVEIKVQRTVSPAGAKRYKINDYNINYKELCKCISRGLCHQEQNTFDEFLSIVSKCSLEVHSILEGGISASVRVAAKDVYSIRLDFVREKNRNYLKLKKGDKVKIKNVSGFKNKMHTMNGYYGNGNGLHNFLKAFGKVHFDEGTITENIILEVLKDGKTKYEEAVKRSEKLLKESIKSVGAKVVNNIKYGNQTIRLGYEIVANSGNVYIVSEDGGDSHTSNCSVYHKSADGKLQYICIVDRSIGNQVGKDKLVNRLFALKNDQMIVGKVSTLKAHVGEN